MARHYCRLNVMSVRVNPETVSEESHQRVLELHCEYGCGRVWGGILSLVPSPTPEGIAAVRERYDDDVVAWVA